MGPDAISIQTILRNTWKQMPLSQRIVLVIFLSAWEIQRGHPYWAVGFGAVMILGLVAEWNDRRASDRAWRYTAGWETELSRRSELADGGHRDCIHAMNEMIAEGWHPPGFKRPPRGFRK